MTISSHWTLYYHWVYVYRLTSVGKNLLLYTQLVMVIKKNQIEYIKVFFINKKYAGKILLHQNLTHVDVQF